MDAASINVTKAFQVETKIAQVLTNFLRTSYNDSSEKVDLMHRSLGIACPEGKEIYELYVAVDSKPSVLARVASALAEKNIDVLTGSIQCSDDRLSGYDIFYVEMSEATVTPTELVHALKKLPFVKDVKIESKSEIKFENMMFPLTRSGHTRVFVISADGWAALVDSILSTFGTAGAVILHNQGVSVGGEIVDSIRSLLHPPIKRDSEMANLKAYFGAVGLGLLEVSGDQKAMKVTIDHPVTPDKKSPGVDQFLVGMVRGAIAKIHAHDYVVQNLAFVAGKIHFNLVREVKG